MRGKTVLKQANSVQSKSFTPHLTTKTSQNSFQNGFSWILHQRTIPLDGKNSAHKMNLELHIRNVYRTSMKSSQHPTQNRNKNNKTGKGMTSKITTLPCHMRRGKLAPA